MFFPREVCSQLRTELYSHPLAVLQTGHLEKAFFKVFFLFWLFCADHALLSVFE